MSEKTAPPPWAAGAATPPAPTEVVAAPILAPAAPETALAAPAAAEATPPAQRPAPAPKKLSKAQVEAEEKAKEDTEQNEALRNAANAAKGENEAVAEKIVTVTSPRAFRFRVDDHTEVQYKAGIQEMPESHAKHWWSVNNGVEIYAPASKQ
jgi:hypothetical protein